MVALGGESTLDVKRQLRVVVAEVCSSCRFYKLVLEDAEGWKGECRMTLDRGMFPPSAPACNHFLARDSPLPQKLTPTRSSGRKRNVSPVIRSRPLATAREDVEIPELEDMTREELKAILREAISENLESEVLLAPKWEGGKVVLQPSNPELQAKEISIDALFHKVVMVRDRLRVLEQRINAHSKLSDAEKVEMQQYVTRCYGSLTSFNLLFAEKHDCFVGEKGQA
jgi:hypothetical protein